jgi:tetratricopeptide (TPR) repeat protein
VGEETARDLVALGYAGADAAPLEFPNPLARTDRPAPHERIAEYTEFSAAQALAQTGHFAEAVAKLEPLVAANPLNLAALDELGNALVELGQWQRAASVLEERVKHPPDHLLTRKNLVRCYTELGDAAKAREHTLRSLELLIESHERRGEHERAQQYRALYDSEVGKKGQ